MASLPRDTPNRSKLGLVCLFLFGAVVCVCGCQQSGLPVVDDPQLKPIQAMLHEHLPLGSTQGTVTEFLSAQAYPMEPSDQADTIIAKIRHIDTERMQPVTARVTFHFDANGKLIRYEIVRTLNDPIPQ
ncbi:MAG TPA: hypothetical protein VK703_16600 [Candidatus Acidoferrales bacterium]|nr:hypothetical protein [Candidatus Acidoferrales bacterium]